VGASRLGSCRARLARWLRQLEGLGRRRAAGEWALYTGMGGLISGDLVCFQSVVPALAQHHAPPEQCGILCEGS
jgi:hypothetical protein